MNDEPNAPAEVPSIEDQIGILQIQVEDLQQRVGLLRMLIATVCRDTPAFDHLYQMHVKGAAEGDSPGGD